MGKKDVEQSRPGWEGTQARETMKGKPSYARTDIRMGPKNTFSAELKNMKRNPKDRRKINSIIEKYRKK